MIIDIASQEEADALRVLVGNESARAGVLENRILGIEAQIAVLTAAVAGCATQGSVDTLVARIDGLELLRTRLVALEALGISNRLATLELAVKALQAPPIVVPPIVVPPGGVTYYRTNFADGTLGPLAFSSYGGSGQWAPSTDYHDPDSPRSIKCTVPGTRPDDSAELVAQFGQGSLQPADPTLDRDLFQQVRFVIAPGAGLSVGGPLCTGANAGCQFKVHKSTYGSVGNNVNGWVMSAFGPCVGHAGIWTEAERYGQVGAYDDIRVWPNAPFVEGVVYDTVYRYHRYPAVAATATTPAVPASGTVALWVNGTKVLDTVKRPYLGFTGGSTAGLRLRDGAEYLENPKGPFSVYVLFTQATNYPIGAAVASA